MGALDTSTKTAISTTLPWTRTGRARRDTSIFTFFSIDSTACNGVSTLIILAVLNVRFPHFYFPFSVAWSHQCRPVPAASQQMVAGRRSAGPPGCVWRGVSSADGSVLPSRQTVIWADLTSSLPDVPNWHILSYLPSPKEKANLQISVSKRGKKSKKYSFLYQVSNPNIKYTIL